jgi:hypothetical protein
MSGRLTTNAANNLSTVRKLALDTFILAVRDHSSNNNLLVTSTERSSTDQASAMLNNYNANPSAQRNLYGASGQKVLDYFDAHAKDSNQSKIDGAAKLIDQLSVAGTPVSHHNTAYQKATNSFVFDIAYSSITDKTKLTSYLTKLGASKILNEPANKCLHVEIKSSIVNETNIAYLNNATTTSIAAKPTIKIGR